MTQRAIHKLEQGDTEPRRASVRSIEEVWRGQGVDFEDLPDGGFRVNVRSALLDRPAQAPARRRVDLGVTSLSRRTAAHRA